MDKLAALNEILQLDPANAFARYGLAMEHATQGNSEAALTEFAACVEHNPDYVPAYQMSAQTLVKLGRTEEAHRRNFRRGIAEGEGMHRKLPPAARNLAQLGDLEIALTVLDQPLQFGQLGRLFGAHALAAGRIMRPI